MYLYRYRYRYRYILSLIEVAKNHHYFCCFLFLFFSCKYIYIIINLINRSRQQLFWLISLKNLNLLLFFFICDLVFDALYFFCIQIKFKDLQFMYPNFLYNRRNDSVGQYLLGEYDFECKGKCKRKVGN